MTDYHCQHLAPPGTHPAGLGGDRPYRALAELVEVRPPRRPARPGRCRWARPTSAPGVHDPAALPARLRHPGAPSPATHQPGGRRHRGVAGCRALDAHPRRRRDAGPLRLGRADHQMVDEPGRAGRPAGVHLEPRRAHARGGREPGPPEGRPLGRPGERPEGFGVVAGEPSVARSCGTPRRTRSGDSRGCGRGRSHGSR